jgi:hypothetical protein
LNTHHIIIAVIVLQQGLLAGVWLLMVWLRMSRRAALHWGRADRATQPARPGAAAAAGT